MAPQLTPAQREQIIALSNNGCGVSEIQRQTGIARKTVYFWLRRYEETGGDLIAYRRAVDYRSTTPAQDAAIIAAHRNEPSRSTKETASEFNVSVETVRRRIKESLAERKPPKKNVKKAGADQNSMPVTDRQLEVLVEFAEHNLDLALCTKGTAASVETQNAWKELTIRLNSLPGGINKTAERWRRYWIELKSKIRSKSNCKRFLALGCDSPSPLEISCGPYDLPLSADLEERILAIIKQKRGYKSPVFLFPEILLQSDDCSRTSPPLTPTKQQNSPSETMNPTPASPETRNFSALSPETENPTPLPPKVKNPPSSPDYQTDSTEPLPEPKVEMEWHRNFAESKFDKEHEVWTVIPPAPTLARDPAPRREVGKTDWDLPEHIPKWAVEMEERRAATEERLTAAIESISNNLNQIAANVNELLTRVQK